MAGQNLMDNNPAAMGTRVKPRLKPDGQPNHFIKQWRDHRGLSQERLADRVGKATSTISQLENGKQGYSQPLLEALADALQCSPADLIMRDPTQDDAIWSIWESLDKEERQQAIAILRTFKKAS